MIDELPFEAFALQISDVLHVLYSDDVAGDSGFITLSITEEVAQIWLEFHGG
jgi:hypothetical protein